MVIGSSIIDSQNELAIGKLIKEASPARFLNKQHISLVKFAQVFKISWN